MSRLVVRAAVTVMLVSTATWMVSGPTVTATVLRAWARGRRQCGPGPQPIGAGDPSNGADDSFAVKVRRLGRSLRSRPFGMAQTPP